MREVLIEGIAVLFALNTYVTIKRILTGDSRPCLESVESVSDLSDTESELTDVSDLSDSDDEKQK